MEVEVRRAEAITVQPAEVLPPAGEFDVPNPAPATPSLEEAFAETDARVVDLANRKKVQFTLEAGVLADDNVFLSAREPVSDTLFHFSPSITLSLGDVAEVRETYLLASYKPEAFWFLHRHEENTVDHTITAAARKQWARLAIEAAAGYQRTSGSTVDLGGRIPRDIWQGSTGFTYGWGTKTSFSTAIAGNATRYYQPGFANSNEWRHEAFIQYQATEKTQFALGGAWGRLSVDGEAERQKFHQLLTQLHYRATDKISVTGRLGMEWRETAAGRSTTPVYGIEAAYRPREGTRFSLQSSREVVASGDLQGQNYTRTSSGLGVEQKIGDPFTLNFRVGWERYAYSSANPTITSGRKDYTYYIRPSFLYDFAERWRAELWYQWRSVQSNVADQTYKAQQIGLNVRYEF